MSKRLTILKTLFKPSSEWTKNYLHLMRWGWYPGTTEVRRYMPGDSYPAAKAFWLSPDAPSWEEDGSPTLHEVINS